MSFRIPELTYPLAIDTIGKMLAIGNEASATCHNQGCTSSFRVNLVAIASRKGMDYGCMAPDLLRIVHCRACRAAGRPDRNLTFTQHIAEAHSRWPRRDRPPSPFSSA